MDELANASIGAAWTSRPALVKALRALRVRSLQPVIDYNARLETDNPVNLVPSVDYRGVGRDLQFAAIASALDGEEWLNSLARAVAYGLFSAELNYFWHENFLLLYRDSGRRLHMFNIHLAIVDMAFAFVLGWTDAAVHQGYLTHAALIRQHYLQLQYENEQRRAHAFMLRLFADWRGDVSHAWPAYAYDEPVYERLLAHWRVTDPAALAPLLLAACDLHTHQARRDTSKKCYDFSDYTLVRTPLEVLMLLRLREIVGLENPVLAHPLMDAPFGSLPETQVTFQPDALMCETLARVRQDWPQFDSIVAIDSIKAKACPPVQVPGSESAASV